MAARPKFTQATEADRVTICRDCGCVSIVGQKTKCLCARALMENLAAWANSEEGQRAIRTEILRHNRLPKIYTEGFQWLSRQVLVVEPLGAWLFLEGWGSDAPFTHEPGSKLRLAYQEGPRIYYADGAECASSAILGYFKEEDLTKVQDQPE